jgi:hypothetical protein
MNNEYGQKAPESLTDKNKKKVNGYSYADGYRDRQMHPTKGVTNAKESLSVLKTKIK